MANKSQQKRFSPKLHVKKGDKVKIIAGKNKGSVGEILKIFPTENRALVEGLNMVTKHQKPNQNTNEEGGLIQKESPIHLSNLMIIDPKSGNPTRVGRKEMNGKLVRYSKKSGEIIG